MLLQAAQSRVRGSGRRLFSSATKYYDLLNVSKTASDDEIKKAYKKAALEHHPDRGGDSDKFKEISHAYSVLSDPSKRQLYDQFGEKGVEQGAGMGGPAGGFGEDPMDIFSQVFGGAARRRSQGGMMRGRDAVYNLELSLEDIARGTTRTIAYNRDVSCASCGGRGATKIDPCKRCGGSGVVMTRQNIGFLVHMQTACPDCNGEGYRVPRDGHCRPCKGSGIVSQKEVFEVKVPKGCPAGHQFRFAGKADQLPGHTAGDVIVQVKPKDHPLFKRMGNGSPDIAMKREITLTEALAGCRFEISDLVDGSKLTVAISGESVVAPDDVFVVRGKGLPRFDGSTRGDVYVKFSVKFPTKIADLNEKEKNQLNTVLFGGQNEKKGCLTALFGEPEPAPVSTEKAITMDKVNSGETKRKVNESFEVRQERKTQQHSGMHVDPQQCQQQ